MDWNRELHMQSGLSSSFYWSRGRSDLVASRTTLSTAAWFLGSCYQSNGSVLGNKSLGSILWNQPKGSVHWHCSLKYSKGPLPWSQFPGLLLKSVPWSRYKGSVHWSQSKVSILWKQSKVSVLWNQSKWSVPSKSPKVLSHWNQSIIDQFTGISLKNQFPRNSIMYQLPGTNLRDQSLEQV